MTNVEKSSPFYSVIIPSYNRSRLIEPTIKSIFEQSCQDFEVIVVDDFSSDIAELEALLLSFNDKRIKLFKHDENKNGAAARNTGIAHASGQYITFLDSDDTWPKNRLSIIKKEIQQDKDRQSSIFYGQVDFKFPDETTGVIKPTIAIKDLSVADYLFVQNGLMQTSTITCHKDVAKSVLFDERFIRHQDYDFCLRAQAMGYQFKFIEQVLSNWLRHKGANVINKGAKVDFCLFWLEQMQRYFSIKSKSAYLLKVVVPIAFESGRWKTAFALYFANMFKVTFSILFQGSYRSIKSIAKYFLRTQ